MTTQDQLIEEIERDIDFLEKYHNYPFDEIDEEKQLKVIRNLFELVKLKS